MTKAAVYLRMSRDRDGTGLGIERQRQAVKSLAGLKGWTIDPSWVIEENDVSASKKKPRPGFERLLKGMASGEVEAVLAYAMDRLVRGLNDTVRLIDIAEEHRVPVALVSGELDLSTPHGRGNAKLLGVVASIEIDNMSGRHRQAKQAARLSGSMRGGGVRPYGFTANRSETVPEEAEIIREMARRVLQGESPTRIYRDLNRREIKRPKGGMWSTATVIRSLQRPALCGRVVHKGEVLRDADGDFVRGEWTPILTDEEFDDLQVALAARKRTPYAAWSTNRVHLLSGIARCGICGHKMFGVMSTQKIAYQCPAQRHLSRLKESVDALVIAKVRERAETHRLPVIEWSEETANGARRELALLEGRKRAAIEEFTDGQTSPALLKEVLAGIERRIDQAQARLLDQVADRGVLKDIYGNLMPSGPDGSPMVPAHDTSCLGDPNGDLEEQRKVVSFYVEAVIIRPAPRGRSFDPSLVEIQWRDLSRYGARMVRVV